jgi:hypothetical protein
LAKANFLAIFYRPNLIFGPFLSSKLEIGHFWLLFKAQNSVWHIEAIVICILKRLNQETITEGEGSVRLTSLACFAKKMLSVLKATDMNKLFQGGPSYRSFPFSKEFLPQHPHAHTHTPTHPLSHTHTFSLYFSRNQRFVFLSVFSFLFVSLPISFYIF